MTTIERPAVKLVGETDDAWIIEGLILPIGGPINGQDLTGTHFTKDTDFALDWFPDGGRPGLYRHGFDPEVGISVVGRETKSWSDERGRWLRAQIDKAHEYAAEIKQLLDEGLLSLSSGAVDHLVQIASKSGEIVRWPWVEWSLVPNPANPEAIVYQVKSTEAAAHLRVIGAEEVAARFDSSEINDLPNSAFAVIEPAYEQGDTEDKRARHLPHHNADGTLDDAHLRAAAARAEQITPVTDSITTDDLRAAAVRHLKTHGMLSDRSVRESEAADDATSASYLLGSLTGLLGDESDEAQAARLRTAIEALQAYIAAEVAEVGTPEDVAETAQEAMNDMLSGWMSRDRATREGRRNSTADLSIIQSIHDASSMLGADCAGASGKAADAAPAHVLAVRAGDDVEPATEADLAAIRELLITAAVETARRALGT